MRIHSGQGDMIIDISAYITSKARVRNMYVEFVKMNKDNDEVDDHTATRQPSLLTKTIYCVLRV